LKDRGAVAKLSSILLRARDQLSLSVGIFAGKIFMYMHSATAFTRHEWQYWQHPTDQNRTQLQVSLHL